jgi:DNA-binding MarR family transcriptional regulator
MAFRSRYLAPEVVAMKLLAKNPEGVTVSALSAATGMTYQRATSVLDRLEAKGEVVRIHKAHHVPALYKKSPPPC